jgi:xanthine/uracil permease
MNTNEKIGIILSIIVIITIILITHNNTHYISLIGIWIGVQFMNFIDRLMEEKK